MYDFVRTIQDQLDNPLLFDQELRASLEVQLASAVATLNRTLPLRVVAEQASVRASDALERAIALASSDRQAAPRFSYSAPAVSLISPGHGSTHGGTRITVEGENFGYSAEPRTWNISIEIGGRPCTNVVYISEGRIVCAAPPGVGIRRSVVVNVADVHSFALDHNCSAQS